MFDTVYKPSAYVLLGAMVVAALSLFLGNSSLSLAAVFVAFIAGVVTLVMTLRQEKIIAEIPEFTRDKKRSGKALQLHDLDEVEEAEKEMELYQKAKEEVAAEVPLEELYLGKHSFVDKMKNQLNKKKPKSSGSGLARDNVSERNDEEYWVPGLDKGKKRTSSRFALKRKSETSDTRTVNVPNYDSLKSSRKSSASSYEDIDVLEPYASPFEMGEVRVESSSMLPDGEGSVADNGVNMGNSVNVVDGERNSKAFREDIYNYTNENYESLPVEVVNYDSESFISGETFDAVGGTGEESGFHVFNEIDIDNSAMWGEDVSLSEKVELLGGDVGLFSKKNSEVVIPYGDDKTVPVAESAYTEDEMPDWLHAMKPGAPKSSDNAGQELFKSGSDESYTHETLQTQNSLSDMVSSVKVGDVEVYDTVQSSKQMTPVEMSRTVESLLARLNNQNFVAPFTEPTMQPAKLNNESVELDEQNNINSVEDENAVDNEATLKVRESNGVKSFETEHSSADLADVESESSIGSESYLEHETLNTSAPHNVDNGWDVESSGDTPKPNVEDVQYVENVQTIGSAGEDFGIPDVGVDDNIASVKGNTDKSGAIRKREEADNVENAIEDNSNAYVPKRAKRFTVGAEKSEPYEPKLTAGEEIIKTNGGDENSETLDNRIGSESEKEGNDVTVSENVEETVDMVEPAMGDVQIAQADQLVPVETIGESVVVTKPEVATIANQIASLLSEAEMSAQRKLEEKLAEIEKKAEQERAKLERNWEKIVERVKKEALEERRALEAKAEEEKVQLLMEKEEILTQVAEKEKDVKRVSQQNKNLTESLDEAEENLQKVLEAQSQIADASRMSTKLQAVSQLRKIRQESEAKDAPEEVIAMLDSFIEDFRK